MTRERNFMILKSALIINHFSLPSRSHALGSRKARFVELRPFTTNSVNLGEISTSTTH